MGMSVILGMFTPSTCYLALAALVASTYTPAAAQSHPWSPAAFETERSKTVQGCVGSDEYVCAYVRCDSPGVIGFYVAAPGPDTPDTTEVDIDGKGYSLWMSNNDSTDLPYVRRARSVGSEFIGDLKTGKALRFRNTGFKPAFRVIQLRNAGPQIAAVEKTCGIVSTTVTMPIGTMTSDPGFKPVEGAECNKAVEDRYRAVLVEETMNDDRRDTAKAERRRLVRTEYCEHLRVELVARDRFLKQLTACTGYVDRTKHLADGQKEKAALVSLRKKEKCG